MVYNMDQGTEEWLEVKRGKFSASNFGKLMSNAKGYDDLINQIVYERITGKSVEHHVTKDMERGTEREPEARQDYEFITNNKVELVGFIELDEWVGVSPDGLINNEGLLEIKCPKWNTHLDYLLKGKLPSTYKWQVQGQLYVTERKWVDFYSYHPDLDPLLLRVERDETMIEELRQKLDKSIELVQERINKLKEK